MTAVDHSLDTLRRELLDRLSQNEQRTMELEEMIVRAGLTPPPIETPRPFRTLKKSAAPQEVILSTVVASLEEAIWSVSPDGERVYVLSGGVERIHGRPAQEFLERPGLWLDVAAEAALRDAFRGLNAEPTFELEHAIRTPDGKLQRVSSRGKLIRGADGSPLRVDGITRIVQTEDRIRELEERLAAAESQSREAGRLEGVARLLSGAAHDFNNLLTIITGHAELVRENLMPDDPLCEPVELIASSGHTAARIARQLVGYAQPADSQTGLVDPNIALRDAELMLRRFAGDRIDLDFLLAPDISPIRVDRSEFDRVVLNLVVNARDAIEDTGIITVRTAMAEVSAERRGWAADCPPGEYVALTVTDTGCGMTEEVQARAFTRYFTTKGDKGTGLGLATVQEIVHSAGGHIELESSPEWGTSIRVFWPAVDDDDDEAIRLSL